MSETFPAYLITKTDSGQTAELKHITLEELMDGDVTVKVEYSTLNYKDGLALTGKAPIVRRFPLVPGIDFAGRVISSDHPGFKQGDQVILNGFGVGEVHSEFSGKAKPLAKERWAAAIDVAGGNTLANVLSQINYGGAVAACGLAESMELPTSVAPFILRGVTLYGVDSVMASIEKRQQAWGRLAKDLDLNQLEKMIVEIPFEDIPVTAEAILKGKVRGRTVIKIPN
jgi:acrylyl-CoA reductase (NADPH)